MANDYRILDERDIKNFQAGNKLNVTEIDNKVTYEHIGEPPNKLPSKEQALEYGGSFDITVPSVYDSTGHVKSETTYSFKMPDKVDTSNDLTKDTFGDIDNNPVSKKEENNKIIYYHDDKIITNSTSASATELTYGGEFSVTALSAADGYGHATEQKTYKFKMPGAPSSPTVDTSGFLTTSNFKAGNLINVATDTQNKTVTYSHQGVTVGNDSDIPLSLNYGNTVNFTIFSDTDDYGHVNKKRNISLTMPEVPTVKQCVTNNTWFQDSQDGLINTQSYNTEGNVYPTTICFVTFFPGVVKEDTTGSKTFFTDPFTIPFPTYASTTMPETYNVNALQITTTTIKLSDSSIKVVKSVDIVTKQITIQLTYEDSTRLYLHIEYPKGFIDKIEAVGF